MKTLRNALPLLSILGLAVVVACNCSAPVAPPAAEKAEAPAPPPVTPPTPEEMMAAYTKAGTPGPNHAWLAKLEGTWAVEAQAWMGGPEPTLSQGRAEMKMILGGRFLEQRYESLFMDQPFAGVGYTGFDNVGGKFVTVWMDNMTTGLYTEVGTLGADGKTLATVSTHLDPVTGRKVVGHTTNTLLDDGTYLSEMREAGADGKEVLVMTLTYKRVK